VYSPKIREDLIPKIYRAAKSTKVVMTKWVNQVIEETLSPDAEEKGQETNERNFKKEDERGDS